MMNGIRYSVNPQVAVSPGAAGARLPLKELLRGVRMLLSQSSELFILRVLRRHPHFIRPHRMELPTFGRRHRPRFICHEKIMQWPGRSGHGRNIGAS